MQLILILAVMLLGGSDTLPILKQMGGEEIMPTIEEAEKISEVINAAMAFSAELKGGGADSAAKRDEPTPKAADDEESKSGALGLIPIEKIASDDILIGLKEYLAV